VTVSLQQLHQRAQDEHVRGVGEVDPDPHRARTLKHRSASPIRGRGR
jgi:hypothetical protein